MSAWMAGRRSRSCCTPAAVARSYRVFLEHLEAGSHQLAISQNRTYSAPGTSFRVSDISVQSGIDDPVIARAPVLYARRDTIGKFTDVPMIVYAENLKENDSPILQYTVIFTNEDGGTSTRALMARWGRTTDIEYVYREDLKTGRAIIQGKGHKDIAYGGKLEGQHPLLIPVTDNNMVGDEVPSEVRYQIAPILVDLSAHSREQVMDDDPLTLSRDGAGTRAGRQGATVRRGGRAQSERRPELPLR